MKITKKQLRRIIKEEKARLLNEMQPYNHGPAKDAYDTKALARSDGDIKKFTSNLERLIQFGGHDFSDAEIKKAVADSMANLVIK